MPSYPYVYESPTASVIDIDSAKEWLRIDRGVTADDLTISQALESAIDSVEQDIGASLRPTVYEWNTSCFPGPIPTRLISEITSVEYFDGTDYVALPVESYRLIRTGQHSHKLAYTDITDFTYERREDTIRVRFTAGYESVPPGLLQAVRARLGDFYDNRGDGVAEKKTLSDKLTDKYRLPYVG